MLQAIQGEHLVFVTCAWWRHRHRGCPVIAQMARDIGALTVGIVTKPFLFEGKKRMKQAETGIMEMRQHVDTMIVVPNERPSPWSGRGFSSRIASKKADDTSSRPPTASPTLVTATGMINVDFADVSTVMQNGGSALMGTGVGKGENRALEAAQQAITSPLLDNISIAYASGTLIHIVGGDLTMDEVTHMAEIVHEAVGDDSLIIFGTTIDPDLKGEVRMTVIATGFDRAVTGEETSHSVTPPRACFRSPRRSGPSPPSRAPHGPPW
ncbi:MAG: cell division protein FtsZ [Gemmatimonadales bacterium]